MFSDSIFSEVMCLSFNQMTLDLCAKFSYENTQTVKVPMATLVPPEKSVRNSEWFSWPGRTSDHVDELPSLQEGRKCTCTPAIRLITHCSYFHFSVLFSLLSHFHFSELPTYSTRAHLESVRTMHSSMSEHGPSSA
jgi:hypothetical protein